MNMIFNLKIKEIKLLKIYKILKNIIIKYRKKELLSVGENTTISNDFEFSSPENIKIGNNVYIGFGCRFIGYGGIKIGDGTIVAHQVEILTRNHNYDSVNLESIPYDKTYILKEVKVEDNVWIGSHVLILPGVSIGEGAVIGMGSVVTKDIPSFAVVGGNPAKILKYRNVERYNKLKSENKIYLKLKNKKILYNDK